MNILSRSALLAATMLLTAVALAPHGAAAQTPAQMEYDRQQREYRQQQEQQRQDQQRQQQLMNENARRQQEESRQLNAPSGQYARPRSGRDAADGFPANGRPGPRGGAPDMVETSAVASRSQSAARPMEATAERPGRIHRIRSPSFRRSPKADSARCCSAAAHSSFARPRSSASTRGRASRNSTRSTIAAAESKWSWCPRPRCA